ERDVRRRRGRASPAAPPEGRHAIRALRIILLVLAACEGEPKRTAAPTPQPPPPAVPDARRAGSGGAGQLLAHPASRCEECHGKMHDEWKPSAHARAAIGPRYVQMRDHAATAAAGA